MIVSADCGARVKKLRTERGWSQEKLAELARVDVRTIQRLENGSACAPYTLGAVAAAFKIDVEELTSAPPADFEKRAKIELLPRVESGNELCAVVAGAHMFSRNNDPLENDQEADLVGLFIQELCDTGEIWDEIGPGDHVRTEYRFTQLLAELEGFGFYVFASRQRRAYRFGIDPSPLPMSVATLLVLRSTNPAIVKQPSGNEVVATALDELAPAPAYQPHASNRDRSARSVRK